MAMLSFATHKSIGTRCSERRPPNHAINPDVQKRRFALLLRAGYGERYALERIAL